MNRSKKRTLTHYESEFISQSREIRDITLTIDSFQGIHKNIISLLEITDRRKNSHYIFFDNQQSIVCYLKKKRRTQETKKNRQYTSTSIFSVFLTVSRIFPILKQGYVCQLDRLGIFNRSWTS